MLSAFVQRRFSANLEGVEPDPTKITFGMPVEMYVEPAMNQQSDGSLVPRVDRDGNTIIAYKFRPEQQ